MPLINIFAVPNGVGISRDVELIKNVLTAGGYDVVTNHVFRYAKTKQFDLSIHLERFKPESFSDSKKNVMIPNQEWFESAWLRFLPAFDYIFTKSKMADHTFRNLGCKTEYISFTSDDRFDSNVKKDESHWFHCAGKSVQKQTETIYKTWMKNPGFPQLTILQDPKFYKPRPVIKNINYCYDRVTDGFLKTMQNTFGVHVCPSETEGFGHYINEALSCKAIVITTDGPPMNELVTSERGILCKYTRDEPVRQSRRYVISESNLEQAVQETMVLDENKRESIRLNARTFYEQNDLFFRKRLLEAVAAAIN
jgi:hypothetical protein